ncbi:response regulator transcription factor [Dactylosporangium sp. AC04546]|uniref:response regulator n=1 Tax=Dactylosporangium sp. AC04546 TaxID=2862460 RepID=UPI001EDEEB46|nr:response regulator transcription factor [Dactylosporangium sp. AC04546]WVK87413.1 response regulator transcription factor [Dactylosporangium sp. AC04546]
MSTRVVLVDDQPLIRSALRVLIADAEDLVVVGEAGTGDEAVALVAREAPDVVVMDIRMPGMDGIEATRRIVASGAAARVLVLTTFDDDEYVYGALRAGASGFVVKDMALDDILGAVRVVAGGDAIVAPRVTRLLVSHFVSDEPATAPRRVLDQITEREREVLTLIGQGRSNHEIADDLHITVATVKAHVARLLTKLDARDRVQLVIIAFEARLVVV